MSWIKITISHGPGHQSETVKYKFLHRPTKTDIDEAVEEEMARGDYDWPVIKTKKVLALPASEHKSLVQHYNYRRDNAISMLEILKKTKTSKEYEWRCAKCGIRWTRHAKRCPNAMCGGRVKRSAKKP